MQEKPKKGKKTAADKTSSKGKQTAANKSSSSSKGKSTNSSSTKVGRITGYNLFTREMRPSIAAAAASAEGTASRSVLSLVAAAWRELTDEQKAGYNERARQANDESAAAAAGPSTATAATATHTSRSRNAASSTTTASDNGAVGVDSTGVCSFSSSSSSSSRARSRTRPQLSGYQLFCQQQRGPLLAANPGLKPSQVMSELGAAQPRGQGSLQQHAHVRSPSAAAARCAGAAY